MTSLRNFQNEIDEIHTREIAKQRAQTITEREKENKNPHPKGKAKEDGAESAKRENNGRVGVTEVEEEIQVIIFHSPLLCLLLISRQKALLSRVPSDHDRARDLIAAIITQHHGEYVLRIGSQPPHAKVFTGELLDDPDGWTGIPRTEEELDTLCQEITRTVEEVGGKVWLQS